MGKSHPMEAEMGGMGLLWGGSIGEFEKKITPWRKKWMIWDYFGEEMMKI